jgi:hypothetical protein
MFIMALHGLVKLYLVDIVMFYILKNSKTPVTEAFGSNSQKVGLGAFLIYGIGFKVFDYLILKMV